MKDYLNGLNKEQRQAVENITGYNLVIAGAGTGKTHTMVSKIAYMIDNGIKPRNILMLTFTNKAAGEMKDRIVKYVGSDASWVTASTFHSFFVKFLRAHSWMLDGYNGDFSVLNESDRFTLMTLVRKHWMTESKEFLDDEKIDRKRNPFPSVKMILNLLTESVNKMKTFEEVIEEHESENDFIYSKTGIKNYLFQVKEIVSNYEAKKREYNVLDFDDMLEKSYQLLKKHKRVLAELEDRYQYVICDEYQDTNILQEALLSIMTDKNGNLTVVGDDNQSIYAFRGAEIENILTFSKRHENCRVIKLVQNYRSTQEILDFSNVFMHYAIEGISKDLVGQSRGSKPQLRTFERERDLAKQLVKEIKNEHISGKSYSDFAVIARTGNELKQFEAELDSQKIPYEKYGGPKYLESGPVQDIICLLRTAINKRDAVAWQRSMSLYPNISAGYSFRVYSNMRDNDTWYEELLNKKYSKYTYGEFFPELYEKLLRIQTTRFSETMEYLCYVYYPMLRQRNLERSKMNEDAATEEQKAINGLKEHLRPLVEMASEYGNAQAFIDEVILDTNRKNDEINDKVNLTTIHSAKGLEYDTVYVVNTIEEIFPRSTSGDKEEPEELRCMYVACTRAKNTLKLFMPMKHLAFYGSNKVMADSLISHFIAYDDVLETTDMDEGSKELYERYQKANFVDISMPFGDDEKRFWN